MSHDDEFGRGPSSQFRATFAGPSPTAHPEVSADGRCCQWRLSSVEGAIPQLRRELRVFLDPAGLSGDESQDLMLAVCEAATNAVEHAQHPEVPFFDVSVELGRGFVTVEVRDHGRWQEPTPSPYRGRGLTMMRALADATITAGPHGTTVTIRKYGAGTPAADEEGWAS